MPSSTIDKRHIDGISELISRVLEDCGIDGWRQWAEAWLDQTERRSGSALGAAACAAAAIEEAESPHNEVASAAFAVADAAARILIYPNDASGTLAWCRAKVDQCFEATGGH